MEKKGQILIVQEEPIRIEINIEDLEEELTSLGINQFFIQQKHCINLYMAQLIVETYDFGRNLSEEEKRGLIQAILDQAFFNKKERAKLNVLVQRLQSIGFEEQDIYGIIINLGVHGKICIGEKNYLFYTAFITGKNNSLERLRKYQEESKCKQQDIKKIGKVSSSTIVIAASESLTEEEKARLTKELETEFGLSEKFIKERRIDDLYIARMIVEGYTFKRKLKPKEKGILIKAIVSNKSTNLATYINRFEQIGIAGSQLYGILINLFVNGISIGDTIYTYRETLSDSNFWELIKGYNNSLNEEVTIKKASERPLKIMRRTVRKKAGNSLLQTDTRINLNCLTANEKENESEVLI